MLLIAAQDHPAVALVTHLAVAPVTYPVKGLPTHHHAPVAQVVALRRVAEAVPVPLNRHHAPVAQVVALQRVAEAVPVLRNLHVRDAPVHVVQVVPVIVQFLAMTLVLPDAKAIAQAVVGQDVLHHVRENVPDNVRDNVLQVVTEATVVAVVAEDVRVLVLELALLLAMILVITHAKTHVPGLAERIVA